jgi:hypothetical protein
VVRVLVMRGSSSCCGGVKRSLCKLAVRRLFEDRGEVEHFLLLLLGDILIAFV